MIKYNLTCLPKFPLNKMMKFSQELCINISTIFSRVFLFGGPAKQTVSIALFILCLLVRVLKLIFFKFLFAIIPSSLFIMIAFDFFDSLILSISSLSGDVNSCLARSFAVIGFFTVFRSLFDLFVGLFELD